METMMTIIIKRIKLVSHALITLGMASRLTAWLRRTSITCCIIGSTLISVIVYAIT